MSYLYRWKQEHYKHTTVLLKLDGCGVFLGRSEYKESNKNLSLVPKMHYDQLYDQCFSFKVNQLSPVWLYLWLIAPGQEKNNNKTLKQQLFRTHFL